MCQNAYCQHEMCESNDVKCALRRVSPVPALDFAKKCLWHRYEADVRLINRFDRNSV